jgi:hypothetical protein
MGAGWIIRAAAILLAIATIATMRGPVGEGGCLQAGLTGLAFLIDAAVLPLKVHLFDPAREWLATAGLQTGAASNGPRAAILFFFLFVALAAVSPARSPFSHVLRLAWSAMAACVAGFLVGMLSLSDPRLPWAMLAGVAFWAAAIQSAAAGAGWKAWPAILVATLLAMMGAGIVPVHFSLAPAGATAGVEGTGWILLWISVALVGLSALGHQDMQQGLRPWASDPAAQAGLSILAVIASASALASQ